MSIPASVLKFNNMNLSREESGTHLKWPRCNKAEDSAPYFTTPGQWGEVYCPWLISAKVVKLKNRAIAGINMGSFETLNHGCMRASW